MNRKRRFFIFFASAGLMCFFIYFTLAVRQDDPLKKWGQWMPGNKVKAMILDRETASGTLPKRIYYNDQVKEKMERLNISALEIQHNLRDANVEFSHEKTKPRETPKRYYLIETINKTPYFVVVEVSKQHSTVIEFGKLEGNIECN
ncbi:MAG: hypothetical protein ACJA0Q_000107 [Saprospiraceae bacterium]|jgi:hypothetical protein